MKKNQPLKILFLCFITILIGTSCETGSGTSGPPVERIYVNGFVKAAIIQPKLKNESIALANASVFLIQNSSNVIIASTTTDLSGRYHLKAEKPGVYNICIEALGFDRQCQNQLSFMTKSNRVDDILLRSRRQSNDDRVAGVFGTVKLADNSLPRGFEPFININSYVNYEVTSSTGTLYKGQVNNLGEYIVPSVPTNDDFRVVFTIDNETKVLEIKKDSLLSPGIDHKIDIQMDNRPPKIHTLSASKNNKPLQVISLGDKVELSASVSDVDGDKLKYFWQVSEGGAISSSNTPTTSWQLPNKKGFYSATLVISDQRGGFAKNSIVLEVTNGGVTFGGQVVDTDGQAIGKVEVDINGNIVNTDASGRFSITIPVKDRYVMNLRKSGTEAPGLKGYGTASHVYSRAINGGQWIMRRAQVTTVDPTKDIVLQHQRDKRDCQKPKPIAINWQKHLHKGLFEWQDGKGYPVSISEVFSQASGSTNPDSAKNVTRMIQRINPNLAHLFVELGKPSILSDDQKNPDRPSHSRDDFDIKLPQLKDLPCLDGIAVIIPANSLIDTTHQLPPSGNVQVALSGISLSTSQMPGDFSADDGSGTALYMESFGAGSIKIGNGNLQYNLKPGAEAEVIIPVDATQIAGGSTPPNQIPFLYYNEQTGVWDREGSATLTNTASGPAYIRKVAHFSSLNADILKTDQSCVAVEVDPAAGFSLPLSVEVIMQPSVVAPDVIQVRELTVDSLKSNVIYNLPNNSDIVLTPIINGVTANGDPGPVPAGVFVVNTGAPQSASSNVPPQNPDGSYYSENADGDLTGPCSTRVILTNLNLPTPTGGEFLQGLSFQASNLTELDAGIAGLIEDGATAYYDQADPRDKRNSYNLFLSENDFGEPFDVNGGKSEVEWDVQFANSGDLGFGRDMHCRRNIADDGEYDIACYVTNYGQPPLDFADQLDADNALANNGPNATVAMEYSRVENPIGDPTEYPDNDRTVKFFVYGGDPDAEPLKKADLDNNGERPIPQLCMVCHGGDLASVAADPLNPTGPKIGSFTSRADIMNMGAIFLPFDLQLYTFPAAKPQNVQETNIKNLNLDIVKEVASSMGGTNGAAVVEVVDKLYDISPGNPGGTATQQDAVVDNWDGNNSSSDSHKFYRDVFAPTCRTCHISAPFGAPVFNDKTDFHNQITNIQNRVCSQAIMPHAKRTSEIFWTSLDPNMAGFFELYGQTLPGWSSAPDAQCGQHYEVGGGAVLSEFATQIYPILFSQCSACHSTTGLANFAIGDIADTYSSIMNTTAKDGSSKYIIANNLAGSLIYQRIIGNGNQMPVGGPDLTVTDTDNPLDGINDANEIADWINSGANGP